MSNAGSLEDEGIYAFSPVPDPASSAAGAAAAPAAPPPRRRAWWPWVLGALALLAVVGTLAAGWAAWSLAADPGRAHDAVQVVIDGEPWLWDPGGGALGFLGVVFGLGLAFVAVMVIVPLALLLALLAVVVSVGLVLGGVLLAVTVVVAVALSPLLLLVLLLWWALRPRRRPAATIAP